MAKLKRHKGKLPYRSGNPKRFLVFSLKDFDINQGQDFKNWECEKILSMLMTRLRLISAYTIQEAQENKILTIYGEFPINTDFKHPKHVSEGVKWARISIQGKERVAGYIEDNIFYIVFLDKDHRFWISEKN